MDTASTTNQENKTKTTESITCPNCGSRNIYEVGVGHGIGAKKPGAKLPTITSKQCECKDCSNRFHRP